MFDEYERIFSKSDPNLHFKNNLKDRLNYDKFRSLISDVRNEYDNFRNSLRKLFNDFESGESKREFYENLPGKKSLTELFLRGEIHIFYDFLENYILNEIVQDSALYEIYKEEGKRKIDKITEIAIQVWSTFLLGVTDAPTDEENKSDWKHTDSDLHMKANRLGDNISAETILEIISNDEATKNPTRSNYCRFMNGETPMQVRRTLQLQFNKLNGMPRVLIAQSMVGREGLNLHEACRRVFLFHPEWNPAVVEQQIGRVDRINSRWEQLAIEYYSKPEDLRGDYPYIEVDFLIFEGTYDQFQFERMKYRRENMAAQLFGALLPEEVLEYVPAELKEEIANAAPDFSPYKVRK